MVMKNNSTPRVFRFEDESSGRYWYIRLVGTPEALEWVCADVVAIIYPEAMPSDYSNYYAQVPPEWKSQQKILTSDGEDVLTTLYESGLYYLMAHANSPLVIPFQQWISQEVMPVIRPKGNYSIVGNSSPQKPSIREQLDTIRLAMDMLYELGGIDERTRLDLREQIVEILQQEQQQKSVRFSTDKVKWSSSNQARHLEANQKTSKAERSELDNRPTNAPVENNTIV
jgi:prophage antirepressor-like protein